MKTLLIEGGRIEVADIPAPRPRARVRTAFSCVSPGQMVRKRRVEATLDQVSGRLSSGLAVPSELDLLISASYGPSPESDYEEEGQDNPMPYMRWIENRNLEVCVRLRSKGKVSCEDFHVELADADRASAWISFLVDERSRAGSPEGDELRRQP